MREFTCIVCTNGCNLNVDDNLNVTGNLCPRGKEFAINEITNPKRTITSTCKTIYENVPVIAVKSDGEINKDDVIKVVDEIKKVTIDSHKKIGDVVISNVINSGVNIVISSNALMEEDN